MKTPNDLWVYAGLLLLPTLERGGCREYDVIVFLHLKMNRVCGTVCLQPPSCFLRCVLTLNLLQPRDLFLVRLRIFTRSKCSRILTSGLRLLSAVHAACNTTTIDVSGFVIEEMNGDYTARGIWNNKLNYYGPGDSYNYNLYFTSGLFSSPDNETETNSWKSFKHIKEGIKAIPREGTVSASDQCTWILSPFSDNTAYIAFDCADDPTDITGSWYSVDLYSQAPEITNMTIVIDCDETGPILTPSPTPAPFVLEYQTDPVTCPRGAIELSGMGPDVDGFYTSQYSVDGKPYYYGPYPFDLNFLFYVTTASEAVFPIFNESSNDAQGHHNLMIKDVLTATLALEGSADRVSATCETGAWVFMSIYFAYGYGNYYSNYYSNYGSYSYDMGYTSFYSSTNYGYQLPGMDGLVYIMDCADYPTEITSSEWLMLDSLGEGATPQEFPNDISFSCPTELGSSERGSILESESRSDVGTGLLIGIPFGLLVGAGLLLTVLTMCCGITMRKKEQGERADTPPVGDTIISNIEEGGAAPPAGVIEGGDTGQIDPNEEKKEEPPMGVVEGGDTGQIDPNEEKKEEPPMGVVEGGDAGQIDPDEEKKEPPMGVVEGGDTGQIDPNEEKKDPPMGVIEE
ncbi:unnamed protein product [Discosporangium mesarthrocarpum]